MGGGGGGGRRRRGEEEEGGGGGGGEEGWGTLAYRRTCDVIDIIRSTSIFLESLALRFLFSSLSFFMSSFFLWMAYWEVSEYAFLSPSVIWEEEYIINTESLK